MPASNPITFVCNQAQELQQWMFESRYEGLSRSYAVSWINSISCQVRKGDWTSNIVARVGVFGLPVICGCSLIQLSCVTLGDFSAKIMGYSRKEVVVIDSEKERPFSQDREVSVGAELSCLIKHVVGCASLVFYWFVGVIISPSIFLRPPLLPLPETKEQINLSSENKNLLEKKDEKIEELHKQINLKTTAYEEAIYTIRQENTTAIAKLSEELKTSRLDALIQMFPIIESNRIVQAEEQLRMSMIEGITLSKEKTGSSEYEQATWGPPIDGSFKKHSLKEGYVYINGKLYEEYEGVQGPDSYHSLQPSTSEAARRYKEVLIEEFLPNTSPSNKQKICRLDDIFVGDGTPFESVKVTDSSKFLNPVGTIKLTIDCSKIESKYLIQILNKPHDIHHLVLLSSDINELKKLKESGALSKINTLIIRQPIDSIDPKVLMEIVERFPNIAAFDIRECEIQSSFKDLADHHIILADYTFNRALKIREPFDNLQIQLDSLNCKLYNIMMYKYHRKDHDSLSRELRTKTVGSLFHPAAPFIQRINMFRSSDIGYANLKHAIPLMKEIFPYVEHLDFTFCTLLESGALSILRQMPVKKIYFIGCEAIFFQKLEDEDKNMRLHQNNIGYSEHGNRKYLTDLPSVMDNLRDLYSAGVGVVVLDNIAILTKRNPKLRDSQTYLEIVHNEFSRRLHPAMREISQSDPSAHPAIYVGAPKLQKCENMPSSELFNVKGSEVKPGFQFVT